MNPNENPVERARPAAPTRKRPAIMDLMQSKDVFDKFTQIMGDNAKSYIANVLQTIQFSPELMTVEPKSVITAAMIAASLDLPIDKNLGFSAIVPYRDKTKGQIAQFQIMTRGYVQLAQRTGQYANIHVTEIYDDELESFDILTGIPTFKPVSDGWRSKAYAESDEDNAESEKHIVGYAATFVLLTGFRKTEYWPIKKIDAHGRRFSKTFNNPGSTWQTNKPAMRKKTVLKALFKWGPLSVNVQKAVDLDGSFGTGMSLLDLDQDEIPPAEDQGLPEAGAGEPGPSEGAPVPPESKPVPEKPTPVPASNDAPAAPTKDPEPISAIPEEAALKMGVPENPAAGAEPPAPATEGQPGLGIF